MVIDIGSIIDILCIISCALGTIFSIFMAIKYKGSGAVISASRAFASLSFLAALLTLCVIQNVLR